MSGSQQLIHLVLLGAGQGEPLAVALPEVHPRRIVSGLVADWPFVVDEAWLSRHARIVAHVVEALRPEGCGNAAVVVEACQINARSGMDRWFDRGALLESHEL